jgi:hypothetical protein
MARKVFFSFHFDGDFWRTQQVRNIGAIEKDTPVSPSDWEAVKQGGDPAIKAWIANHLTGTSCTVVLIGAQTAQRPWVIYEIQESWNAGKGVVGIYINSLKDQDQKQSSKGTNPLDRVTLKKDNVKLSTRAKTYDPSNLDSTLTYKWISDNLSAAVEEAIQIRAKY